MRRIVLAMTASLLVATANAGENPAGRTRTGDVGDALEIIMPVAALSGTLINKDWEGGKQFGYGLLTTLVATNGLKAAISKERPDGRNDDSFPSSHTAVSFHTATYLQERYGWKFGLPAYVAASYVGYSRAHDEAHDEQDVIAGAVIGYLAARYFTTEYRGVEVAPVIGEDVVGLTFSYRH